MARYGDHREGMGGLGVNDPGGTGFGADKTGQGPGNDKPDNDKPDNFKGLALTDEDGNLVTFGENNTPVGLTERYFTNNPQNIQSAYDAGLMGTGLASTFSGQGLLNTNSLTSANTNINPNIIAESVNQLALEDEDEEAETENKKTFMDAFKTLGENAFVDRLMKMGVNENVAKLASAKMNTSPAEAYGMVSDVLGNALSSGQNMLGAGYNALGTSQLTPGTFGYGQIGRGLFSLGEAMFGPAIETLSDFTGIGNYKARKYGVQNPQNIEIGFTGPMTMNEDGNLVQDYEAGKVRYKGPMTAAIADEVAEIQGGFLSPEQQADLAIERYNALETEKNNRPGNPALTNPYIPIDPVRSKYEDEALEAYDRYIENGYSPEEAEYLVAYMGLA